MPSVAPQIFCSKCGNQNASEASFCCKCGTRLLNPDAPHAGENIAAISVGSIVSGIVGQISSVAGVERLDKASPREMFSEVFKKRTPDELEAYFSVGTVGTTPTLLQIDTRWPRPWAFFKAFVGALILFAGLYYMGVHFQNPMSIPAVLMVGAFAVPGSILVLFFEFNAPRNFSLYQLIRLSLLGGVIALVACSFFYGWTEKLGLNEMGASVAAIAEEPAKLLAMLIVANNTRYRWTLNGLMIGACVGTGFAVVETAGYAFMGLAPRAEMSIEGILFRRALIEPLVGHALLSAIVGAGLWRIKGGRRFEWSMLKDTRFLRLFIIAMILHAVRNAPFEWPLYGKYVCVGFVAWLIILSLVQAGLKEVRAAQAVAEAKPESSDAPVAEAASS